MYVKLTIAAIAAGFVIDCFLGDPARFPHPVILIGKAISFLEKVIIFHDWSYMTIFRSFKSCFFK